MQQTRDAVMETLIPDIKAHIKTVTGVDVRQFYYDWGLHNKSGLFLGVLEEDSKFGEALDTDYIGKDLLHQEIPLSTGGVAQ
jgi:hypothetical protein